MAEEALQNGYCDMIGMARALIADPFWVRKVQEGKVEDIVECIGMQPEMYRTIASKID